MKLDFDYCDKSGDYVAEYRGLTIKAVYDTHADCPWESWDGCTPIVVNYGREGLREYNSHAGFPLLQPFSSHGIPDALLRRHMPAICQIFDQFDVYSSWGSKLASFAEWLASEAKHRMNHGDSLTEHKRDLLQDALDGMRDSDKLETLAAVYSAIGWPAACKSSHGYSQGDYAELLIVATPAFVEYVGAPKLKDSAYWQKDMESTRDLYSAWAWGDVYGFVLASDSDDHMDSLWGFYGTDFEESGLSEAARDAADHLIETAQKKRLACLARLIRNRVPLDKRAAMLASEGSL